MIDHSNS